MSSAERWAWTLVVVIIGALLVWLVWLLDRDPFFVGTVFGFAVGKYSEVIRSIWGKP